MNIFIINLDKSEDRLKNYENIKYNRWRAVDGKELDSNHSIFKEMNNNYGPKNYNSYLGTCGCFLSHITLWEHIVKNKLNNILILEDDADIIDELPNIDELPEDGITYLGGLFCNIKLRSGGIKKGVIESKNGINEVDKEKFRLLMTLSYYIPNYKIAEDLLNEIDEWRKKRLYRAIDITISKMSKKIKKYYYYPAIYIERNVESIIAKKTKHPDKYYII